MKTNVGVTLSIEGIHNFPNASQIAGPEVKFLEYPHRHMFGIEAKKRVYHDNRDIEFIMLKRSINSYLIQKYRIESDVLDFGNQSCETIARDLMEKFNLEYCKVDEDKENYAELIKDDSSESVQESSFVGKEVTFIIGKICSGKSFFVEKNRLKEQPENLVIELGDLVREIRKNESRIFDNSLDDQLTSMVAQIVLNCEPKRVFIVGVRQISLLEKLSELFETKSAIVLIVPKKSEKNDSISVKEIKIKILISKEFQKEMNPWELIS